MNIPCPYRKLYIVPTLPQNNPQKTAPSDAASAAAAAACCRQRVDHSGGSARCPTPTIWDIENQKSLLHHLRTREQLFYLFGTISCAF